MEKQEITSCILIDKSAAFDTIDRSILSEVLYHRFGISGTALSWYDSYLNDWQFYVKVRKTNSSKWPLRYGVPQGSCSSANLFTTYCSTIEDVILYEDGLWLNGFADNHTINKSFKPDKLRAELETKLTLQNCPRNISEWASKNHLKMNNSKTEYIHFGSKKQLAKCSSHEINICGEIVQESECVRLLGSWLDAYLSMKEHIKIKSQKAMFSIHKIKHIRQYLTQDTCQQLVSSLVMSHLDYCNNLLTSLPNCDIAKYQRIQNLATKLVLKKSKYDSWTDAFRSLHWLPIKERIIFKLMVLVHNALDLKSPTYIRNMLTLKEANRRGLQLENLSQILNVPMTKCKTFTDRAFSVAAPKNWNNFPDYLRRQRDSEQFKKQLKTYLFKSVFDQ